LLKNQFWQWLILLFLKTLAEETGIDSPAGGFQVHHVTPAAGAPEASKSITAASNAGSPANVMVAPSNVGEKKSSANAPSTTGASTITAISPLAAAAMSASHTKVISTVSNLYCVGS
jgi:hypothetical protein